MQQANNPEMPTVVPAINPIFEPPTPNSKPQTPNP